MELAVLSSFCALLLLCVLFDLSVLYALVAGLFLFLLYGKHKGFSAPALLRMSLSGIQKVKNVLINLLLIGLLTAIWRDAGTVSVLVCYAAKLIHPSVFLLAAFVLNCLVSFLTGTAFGTSATMGVILSTMAVSMGINPLWVGGAILAGAYFGDRCSPVSTSAMLVAEVTQTNIFRNIRAMLRTCVIPFLLSCAIYLAAGLVSSRGGEVPDLRPLFEREFLLSPLSLLPAAVILLLSLLQVKVKFAMTASILTALLLSLSVQQTPLSALPRLFLFGYQATDPGVAAILSGGGVVSMLKVSAIVCLSSCYSGIFRETGLLDGIQHLLTTFARRTTPFTAILCTSILCNVVACNQTLSIMLTQQLCSTVEPDPQRMAIRLENSAVVIAPLVPWSIAGAVPLASVNAPSTAIFFAVFLYLLPLWTLLVDLLPNRNTKEKTSA